MKYIITSLLIMALVVSVANAATTDFIADGDITVGNVGGSDMIIKSGSKAESWIYNSGTFTVTNSDSTNRFKVSSAASAAVSLRVKDSDGTQVSCINNGTPGTDVVNVPSGAGTYTVFPSGSACSVTTVTSSSGGGGGGGGTATTPTPAPVTPVITPTISPSLLPVITPNLGVSLTPKFTRAFSIGMAGSDVMNLQKFLNGRGFVVALVGPGSVGHETTTFGSLTKAALIKFQLAKGIITNSADPGAGTLGPKTRGVINASADQTTPTTPGIGSPDTAKQAQIQALNAQLKTLLDELARLRAAAALAQ